MQNKKLMSATAAQTNAWDLAYAFHDPDSAWDISKAAYVNISKSVSTQTTSPEGIFFKPDGTKMYVIESSGDDVEEYSLSTPWLVTSATHSQAFDAGAKDTAPTDIFFKPDGLKMYFVGDTNDKVYEYSLSTAWDISTATFSTDFSISAEETAPTGLFFKSDGTKMYVVGTAGDDVNEYSLSTAWDISTASYTQNFSVATQTTVPTSLSFKDDGTKMYVCSATSIYEYSLSTAWDISSSSYVQSFSVSAQDIGASGIFFRPGGGGFYIVGKSNDTVYQYSIGGPNVSGQESSPNGIFFKDDGTKMYICGSTGDAVDEWALSTAWNLSTATYTTQFSVSGQDIAPQGIYFSPDGTRLYVVGATGDEVNQYSLSTAWDISTTSFVRVKSVTSEEASPRGVFFKPDGTKMYIVGTSGVEVNEYSLSTAWDISTASFAQSFSVSTQQSTPRDVFFKDDGTKMYVIGSSGDDIDEYSISTAWDISTASYVQNFYVGNEGTNPVGIYFKPDGLQFFVVDNTTTFVQKYSIS